VTEAIAMPIRVSRPVAKAHVMRLFARGLDDDARWFAAHYGLTATEVIEANEWSVGARLLGLFPEVA